MPADHEADPAHGTTPEHPAVSAQDHPQLLDFIDECVVVSDAEGTIRYANRAAGHVLGDRPHELVGEPLSALTGLRPAPAAQGSPTVEKDGVRRETILYRRKDGSQVVLSLATRWLPARGGERPLTVSVLRDISAETLLREQLLQSAKMSAVGELVAGVSHDLNNPLTSIIGHAQLLLGRDQEAGVRRGLEVIAGQADRASAIVRNLLTFARKHTPERRHLGFNGIIQKALELKAHDFAVNHIEVMLDLQPDLPYTLLDFHQIMQVLMNLLINAEQAIRSEGSSGTVRILTRQVGGSIQVRVEDDGPGIPEAARRRVFDPFFTTKAEGGGTGLGLSICHGIVSEHGGAIRAENRPEGGARFVIDLPILDPEAAPARQETGAGPARASAGKQILVVDDEQPIQDLLVAMLTLEGHHVDTASSAEAALKKLKGRRYDLIMSDLRMPGIGGFQLYERILAEDRALADRVVFITGDLASEESRRFMQRLENICLPKPFSLDSLRATLRRFEDRFGSDSMSAG